MYKYACNNNDKNWNKKIAGLTDYDSRMCKDVKQRILNGGTKHIAGGCAHRLGTEQG